MRAYTHEGWAHRQRVSTIFLTWGEKLSHIFLVLLSGQGSNLGSLDLESDTLPTPSPQSLSSSLAGGGG